MPDCTGDSHAAVRQQDVRGLCHFVTNWDGCREHSRKKTLPSGLSLLRALSFAKRVAPFRRRQWRLLDSGAQLNSVCGAANLALREPAWIH